MKKGIITILMTVPCLIGITLPNKVSSVTNPQKISIIFVDNPILPRALVP